MREAALVLEDGSVFVGTPFGATVDAEGEVVFATPMTGYQEVCTDPSYRGQMVVLTYPQIGNYGVSDEDAESTRPWVAALIVRDLAPFYHHWNAKMGLSEYLAAHGVPGLAGVDTRAITRRLRTRGTMRAVLKQSGAGGFTPEAVERLRAEARAVTAISLKDVVSEVSGAAVASWTPEGRQGRDLHIVMLDCGAKHNIPRSLVRRGVRVTALPWQASVDEVLRHRPDGVLLSNGPGDPAVLLPAIRLTRQLLETDVPIMGICLGHQVLGLAIGAKTSRLKFGHHGGNHPVKDLTTGRVYITTQNHEFQVDADSIPRDSGFFVSHVNLNDGSVEGLAHPTRPVFSVQFHPEGCPGPQDNQYLFDRFLEIVAARARSA